MDKDKEIIEAGIVEVKKYGAIFPIDDLCSRINISKKTFYSCFRTKNQLLEKIIYHLIDKWKSESRIQAGQQTDVKTAFLKIFIYHLDEVTNFNSNFLSGLRLKFPNESSIINAYFDDVRTQLLNILKEGQKNNKVKKGYNLEIFLQREVAFLEYLRNKNHVLKSKEDYIKLLTLSLECILVAGDEQNEANKN